MENKFVANGYQRFMRGKKAVTSESIEKKYAAEFAEASPVEKKQIRERMAEEFLRLSKNEGHKPSAGTLW
jgi:hypothetical protein